MRTTRPRSNSSRARAWRHAMIAAINAGLEQKLFGLRPGENYWSEACDDRTGRMKEGCMFEFLVDGVPGIGWVCDAGYDELKIHSILWPTAAAKMWVHCGNIYGHPGLGGAVAEGWVERRDGCYLQPSTSLFRCENDRKPAAAALNVTPRGYGDYGPFRI